ncbi:MAG: transcription elongation factor GreA [Bacteroidaceae bacterium]|nr:transcription elongation factor GreA [Bacteroidaceae bacterium]
MAYMTQAGYDSLLAELHRLEAVERPAASAAIAEARDKGDLSENSEYDAAKEAQAMLEIKITQLKATITSAKIIDTSKLSADTVQILSRVTLKNMANKAVMSYTIVSETEANLREGKISVQTPIAQGLLGHKVGEIVEVKVPRGTMNFEIMDITFDE